MTFCRVVCHNSLTHTQVKTLAMTLDKTQVALEAAQQRIAAVETQHHEMTEVLAVQREQGEQWSQWLMQSAASEATTTDQLEQRENELIFVRQERDQTHERLRQSLLARDALSQQLEEARSVALEQADVIRHLTMALDDLTELEAHSCDQARGLAGELDEARAALDELDEECAAMHDELTEVVQAHHAAADQQDQVIAHLQQQVDAVTTATRDAETAHHDEISSMHAQHTKLTHELQNTRQDLQLRTVEVNQLHKLQSHFEVKLTQMENEFNTQRMQATTQLAESEAHVRELTTQCHHAQQQYETERQALQSQVSVQQRHRAALEDQLHELEVNVKAARSETMAMQTMLSDVATKFDGSVHQAVAAREAELRQDWETQCSRQVAEVESTWASRVHQVESVNRKLEQDVQEWVERSQGLAAELAEAQSFMESVTQERSQIESSSRQALADVTRLSAVAAAAAGHHNHKQRIHMTQMLKEENEKLRQANLALMAEAKSLRVSVKKQEKVDAWSLSNLYAR